MVFLFSSFKLFTHLYSLAGVLIAHVSLLLFLLFINRFVGAAEKQQTYPIFSYFNELSNILIVIIHHHILMVNRWLLLYANGWASGSILK